MAAAGKHDLEAVVIVELDKNGDVMPVWTYPGADEDLTSVIVARSLLASTTKAPPATLFSRYKAHWHYSVTVTSGMSKRHLPKVTAFSIVLVASAFNPERFLALAGLMAKQYASTGQPTRLLETYLSVFTSQRASFGDLTWTKADYDDRMALIAGSVLPGLTRAFGPESVLIWNAMLLRKRIIVYGESLEDVLPVVRTLPQFVWQRQDQALLRPFVVGDDEELADLKSAGVYCCGVTSPEFRSKTDLYDVFIDLPARSIHITEQAKPAFQLGKYHKDVATTLVAAAADASASAQQVVKALAMKTKTLVDTLKTLGTDGGVSLEQIRARKMNPAMESFLWNVANAEGFAVGASA